MIFPIKPMGFFSGLTGVQEKLEVDLFLKVEGLNLEGGTLSEFCCIRRVFAEMDIFVRKDLT